MEIVRGPLIHEKLGHSRHRDKEKEDEKEKETPAPDEI